MGKITLWGRTFFLFVFLFGSTFTHLTAKNKTAVLSITGVENHVSCFNGNNGSIDITISGAVGTYTVSWSGSASTSEDLSGLSAGTYIITVTDSENNKDSRSFVISQPTELTMEPADFTPVSCLGASDGTITAGTVTGGNTNYQYSIDGTTFQASNTFSGLIAKNYTITVKDSKNCIATRTIEVTQPFELTMQPATFTPVSCFGASDGTITAGTVTGGNTNYQYSIDGTTFQASTTFSGLAAKDYTITVKDSKNCIATRTIEVTQPTELTMQPADFAPVSCFGASDGTITAGTVAGGNTNYQYSIDGTTFQASNTFSGLAAKDYTLTVKDSKNCIATQPVEITQPELLNAEVSFTNITCNDQNDGTISVTNFTGGYGTYEFSKDNGNSWQASSEFTNLSEGFFNVLMRDKENPACVLNLMTNLEITRPSPLNADISTVNISCFGLTDGSIIISDPSGGYGNFEFSLDSNNWQQASNFDNLSPGIFTVYIRDAGNTSCVVTLSSTVEITQPELLVLPTVSKTDVLCNGQATGEVTATASGGTAPYTYSWGSLGEGATKTNLPAGTYSVTVTDTNGCETAPQQVVITEPDTFIDIINVQTTSGCYQQNNGTATVEATGGTGAYNYLWSNGQTAQQATGLAPGDHTVTITDENGCSKVRTITVSTPTQLQITGFLTTETTSFGSATGTATVQVGGGSGGYTFLWSNGQTGQSANSLLAGKYTVTVTDTNACTVTDEVIVVDSIEAEIVPTSVCEASGDIIRTSYFKVDETTLRGGTAPYTFEWIFEGDGSMAAATGIGPHRLTYETIGDKQTTMIVRDSNGLEFQQTIIQYVGGCFSDDCGSSDLGIDDYYIGDANGNPITSSNCSNADFKFIYIYIPTNPDRYSLNVELIYSIENIETGEVKNFKEVGCFYEKQAIPDRAETFQIEYTCGNIVKIEGIYLTFSNRKRDNCGEGNKPKCYSTNNNATVDSPLYAVAFPNELLCNGASNGRISVRASGGTSPYQYKLINAIDGAVVRTNQSSEIFENLEAGIYDVIVSDSDNPINTFTVEDVEITEPTNPLTLEPSSITNATCFGGEDGSATVLASGGTPNTTGDPYIYVWSNGQTSPTATNLAAKEYTVKVIDANGCEIQIPVTIGQPEELLAVAGPDQVLECGITSINLEAQFNYAFAEGEEELFGQWTIENGPAGGSFEDDKDPTTLFTGSQGTYTLRWSVPCGASDDVKISFSNCSTIDFDGTDDHIVFGDNFNLSGDFTMEAWIKQDPSTTAGIKTIVSKRDASNLAAGFDLIIDNNIPKFRWNTSSLASKYPIGTDRWYHISVIKGGTNPGLYVDGILVSEGSPGAPTSLSQPFLIGAMYDANAPLAPQNYFHGWIEEVRIWNTAITTEQLQFMMNQKLQENGGKVRGFEIPLNVPGDLTWSSLEGYYQLEISENGLTPGKITGSPSGKLINITTTQQRTAPLPYISTKVGQWYADATWLRPQVWDPPNSLGIDSETTIDWNIASISHNISSGGKNIKLLGLLSNDEKLTIANSNEALNENNSGQSLTITHYLKLNGIIDLVGESQLIQTDSSTPGQSIISTIDESSTGFLERDQQGTASSYNYNYWSSPVVPQGNSLNSTYTVASVLLDGTNSGSPRNIDFGQGVTYADGPAASPRKISNYWLFKFRGKANEYDEYEHIGSTGTLNVGEAYTMKGTSGTAEISYRQNYVFKGKPNNGNITLTIGKDQNYMLGNPYPSALDAKKFILDNLKDSGGTNPTGNIFNGALYFWDHFSGKTHILSEYIGGYATRNLIDGVPAISFDDRINANNESGTKIPGQYIPVGQGFFINTVLDEDVSGGYTVDGGNVLFKNRQRVFETETTNSSQFLKPENIDKKGKDEISDSKIRLDFSSPMGYHRQILVGTSSFATNGFDLGYDAALNDYNLEDFFWLINNREYVIQGVSNFDVDQVLPIGIYISQKGEFKIEINKLENIPGETNIYVKDIKENKYHDLRDSEFKMEIEPGAYYERFEIVFFKPEDADAEPEEETPTDEEIVVVTPEPLLDVQMDMDYLSNNKELSIFNPTLLPIQRVEIYNLLGQKVQEYIEISNLKEIRLPVYENATGIYIVKLFTMNSQFSKNIVIK
ncbi:LamG-like jellyroll fold domain-containing protein [Gillisia sp. Hel_I_86]|uniref:LamG-like jellyroll fold domain-containing protein n=1 Tax=Gillisia sp. Hel_I_86 TaxID=1249981 RepID=UPI0011A76FFD|nr:LamG-like jellyroll fold domain-containing protein [Gillisia sp. Hel_I_86]